MSRAFLEHRREQSLQVEVGTSPISAIPLAFVNFDYHQRGEYFGYEFTKFSSDTEDNNEGWCMCIHVFILASQASTATDSVAAFSFPLSGVLGADWTLKSVMCFLHTQIIVQD